MATGRHRQREVLGAVGVGEHEQPIAGGTRVVLDVVLVPLLARFDDDRVGVGRVGVDQPHLARDLRRGRDLDEATAAGATDADVEAVVVLLEHEHVVARRVPTRWRQTCHGRMASSGRV